MYNCIRYTFLKAILDTFNTVNVYLMYGQWTPYYNINYNRTLFQNLPNYIMSCVIV